MKNLGKYEVLEELGSGSMGTVYRAYDSVIDRHIALKTIRTGMGTEPEMRERFYREARSCGRLQHANIVTIYDLGEEDQTAYIAMELLEGLDFRKLIDQAPDLPIARKLDWMIQICNALGHAHRHGVIHRDVKPSNLFLTKTGLVKVLDFGIARLTSSRLTVAGRILGTPNYMAPEQIRATQCDGRADLFSAGVVFFELLVYKHPFRGAMIPQRIAEGEPDSLFDHQSNLPPLLERVFAKALAKNPDDRYANAALMAADLGVILEAVRHDTSPGFSRVELPSERTEVAAAAIAPTQMMDDASVQRAEAPEGEDSAEWRNSEVLMLLPEFEAAIERKDPITARKNFESLRRVSVGDPRFAEAMADCRSRLEQLESRTESGLKAMSASTGSTVSAGRTISSTPATQRICLECGAGNRSAARFCIGCGANLDETVMMDPAEVDKGAGTGGTQTGSPVSVTPSVTPEPVAVAATASGTTTQAPVKRPATSGNSWLRTNRMWVVLAFSFIVIAMIVMALNRGPSFPMEQAYATASVSAATMDVHAADSALSERLYTVNQGESVNIIKLPDSSTQEWVKVQAVVDGDGQAPGFARRAQLSPLVGRDAASAFALLKLTLETGEEGENQFRQRIQALKSFAAEHRGTPEAATALGDAARAHLNLVKFQQSRGLTGEELTAAAQRALADAQEAKKPEIEAELRAFLPEGAVPGVEGASGATGSSGVAAASGPSGASGATGTEEAKPVIDNAARLRFAERLFRESNYNGAEGAVMRVLKLEPDNATAKALLMKIQRARELERP